MLTILMLGCTPDRPPPAEADATTTEWVVDSSGRDTGGVEPTDEPTGGSTGDVTGSSGLTADTGLPPLELVLHHDDGTPALPGEALRTTMVHGPAGGWFLQPVGTLGPFDEASLDAKGVVYLQLEGATADDQPFSTPSPYYYASEPEAGMVTIGPWPDTDPRLHAEDWQNSETICALEGQERSLTFTVRHIEEPDGEPLPTPTIREVTVEATVRFVLDPIDVDWCAERY